MRYNIFTTLPPPFLERIERVKAALQAEGLGVLSNIDLKTTMKQYSILKSATLNFRCL